MAIAPQFTNTFFLLAVLVVLVPTKAYAFGAGDIPDFAYLNDKAFRHGDIENILETLVKTSGAAVGGSGLLGFASSMLKQASGGKKFTKSDVKKVYFGNWLRDYSQAMDIAGLSKLSADTLVLIVSVLGFMTFGFASDEFQVTADRLGVYLPVEHIDNPKGYAEKEGDARSFHPKLRPPVSEEELEIDSRTGMKKYIATENQGWDTSTAFIRRTFRACIEHGRRAGGTEGAELWEAYRLLGTGLHTMEDLLAHSNWCELALRKLGHKEVFCHVGDNVIVQTPNGPAPPLVTGTFGSADFMHSLLGEAGDKLSQASVTELSAKIDDGSKGNVPDLSFLKSILSKLGGGSEEKLDEGEKIQKQAQAYNFNPDDVAPPDVQRQLLNLLHWHDDIFKSVNQKIEMVPGLTNLMEEFSNAFNEYIYTLLAPYLGPILSQATGILNEGSKAVIDSDDQYEVFTNSNASDPSHSMLSKDHFGLILNEPAGKIAQVVVENSVNLIVQAWGNDENADEVITNILEAFHHPYYASGRSEIQEKMMDHMSRWIGGLGSGASEIIQSLTKESVREHRNKRPGLDNDIEEAGYGGCGHGHKPSKTTSSSGYGQQAVAAAGYANTQTTYGSQHNQQSTHTSTQSKYKSDSYGQSNSYGEQQSGGYNASYGQQGQSYGQGQGRQQYDGYQAEQKRPNKSYGGQQRYEEHGYGNQTQLGGQAAYDGQPAGYAPSYSRPEESSYGRTNQSGGYQQTQPSYGGDQGGYNKHTYGQPQSYQPSYGRVEDNHGRSHKKNDSDSDDNKRKKKHGSDSDDDRRRAGEGYRGAQQGYRQSTRGDDSDDEHKSRRHQGGYGGGQQEYGRAMRRDGSDDEQKSRRHQGGGQQQYGQARHGDDEYPSRRGNDDYSGGGAYGGEQQGLRQGYAPSYGGGGEQQYAPSYGGRDDTFGAERLNIGGHRRDDSDDNNKRHGGRHGYGGDRY